MAGPGASAVLDGRTNATVQHQQARQRLSATHADPRRSRRALAREVRPRRTARVDEPVAVASGKECRGGCARQQTGADRLGRTQQRRTLSREVRCGGGLNRGGKARYAWKTLARFPLSHRTTATRSLISLRVCKKNNGMKQQSNGVPENLLAEM